MAGLFGFGGTASKTDRSNQLDAWGTLSGNASYGASEGKKNLSSASGYFQSLLSGDKDKIAQAISPQTSVIAGQAEQQKKQISEFGGRSGGNAGAGQMINTNAMSAVQNLINTLIPQAATNLANIGTNEMSNSTSSAGTLGSQTEQAREFDKKQEGEMGGGIFNIAKAGLAVAFPHAAALQTILGAVGKK